jgi:hypothetical protein
VIQSPIASRAQWPNFKKSDRDDNNFFITEKLRDSGESKLVSRFASGGEQKKRDFLLFY